MTTTPSRGEAESLRIPFRIEAAGLDPPARLSRSGIHASQTRPHCLGLSIWRYT